MSDMILVIQKTPSPMRILRAWLFRERSVRGVGAIELDVVDQQITREETALRTAGAEAVAIKSSLDRARRQVRAALTDERTPGQIDATEARAIARILIGTSVKAHHHTAHLEKLT